MKRQEEALKLADELLADIELSRLGAEQCLLKANRLARLTADEEAQTWLEFELYGYDNSAIAKKYIKRIGRQSRKEDGVVYRAPLASIQSLLGATRGEVSSLQGASFSGEMILAAQNKHHGHLAGLRETIWTLAAIESGVRAAMYDFVTRTYHGLLFSEIQSELFADLQIRITSVLAPTSGSALAKIDAINERFRSGDPEAISHAMTTCRRLIDSVADSVYPARDDSVEVDGQALSVVQGNVLNRLSAYAYEKMASKGQRDRLRRSLHDIYGRASKGVHADVTSAEAKFVFLQTYVILGEILKLESVESVEV